MNNITSKIKSFFIENQPDNLSKNEIKGLYVVKLKKDFREQFPITLKRYIQLDTLNPNSYTLTNKIYSGLSFGHRVLLTQEEANNIIEELYAIPLEAILVSKESVVDDNV